MTTQAADYWFAARLHAKRTLFLGLTDSEIRRERIRKEIIARGVADQSAGRNRSGETESFRALFERMYGVPLHVEPLTLEPRE
jgi:hypothetical protein